MKNDLFVVFKFLDDPVQGKYEVIQSFDINGEVDLEVNERSFETKEELTEYLKVSSEETKHESIKLLALGDLNIGIESCHKGEDLYALFDSHGSTIDTSSHSEKKSFLSKIF